MNGAPHKDKRLAPSVPAEGARASRRLYLKAANDNRAPLFYRIKKLSMVLLPLLMIAFFAAAWYFGSA